MPNLAEYDDGKLAGFVQHGDESHCIKQMLAKRSVLRDRQGWPVGKPGWTGAERPKMKGSCGWRMSVMSLKSR